MKRIILCIISALALVTGCTASENTKDQTTENQSSEVSTTEMQTTEIQSTESREPDLKALEVAVGLLPLEYDRPATPDAEQLSVIRYILQNTGEVNIHKMRGETENKVYVNEDGREAVYDKDGNLVTNSYNQGTYNFYSNETEPIKKFIYDTAPWLVYGTASDDPTTFKERLYHYTLDLDMGIQNYIFYGADKALEAVPFEELSETEKEVYYLFLKLLFNENYSAKLTADNIQKLKEDGDFYFQYFDQIQEALSVLGGFEESADNSSASTSEDTDAKDLPIDITKVSFNDETSWDSERYEQELYSFEGPGDWEVVDGTEHGLVSGVFLVPSGTDMDNFRFSAHVAVEVLNSKPAGGRVPDFSSEAIQKEFFAAQIIQTYAKMGGLSDLEFSVWESAQSYVYIASFKRSNDKLSMYQTTYYVMNPERMIQVQASHFGEDAVPAVNEVARHLINTFKLSS